MTVHQRWEALRSNVFLSFLGANPPFGATNYFIFLEARGTQVHL